MNLFRVACLYWNTLQHCLISRNCSVCSSVVVLCPPIHEIVADSVVLQYSFGEFFFFSFFITRSHKYKPSHPLNVDLCFLLPEWLHCWLGCPSFHCSGQITSRQKVEQLSFFLLYGTMFYVACFHCLKIIVSHFFQFSIFYDRKVSPAQALAKWIEIEIFLLIILLSPLNLSE